MDIDFLKNILTSTEIVTLKEAFKILKMNEINNRFFKIFDHIFQ
jgi:hypothetical protein